ncbi:MAG TPA: hypothetical protein VLX28_22075 [Thermoanaerobaculia bacterium]|nr:hypothetical protein [Thermoanaerobaculia bacterium]
MTCKRLRLAVAVLVGLVLLGAPAARALPGIGGVEGPALPSREAPGFFASLWGLFTRLVPMFELNRASIDPDGAQAVPNPTGAQADPDNRASIDPNG